MLSGRRSLTTTSTLPRPVAGLVPTVALPVATLGGHQQQLATAVAGLRRDVDDLRRQLAGLRAEVRAQAQRRP